MPLPVSDSVSAVEVGTDTVDRRPIIVSRHAGAIEWLRQRGIMGEVVAHASEETVRGRQVYGTLPLHLAAFAGWVHTIEMDLEEADRGRDLSPAEMDARHARIESVMVLDVETACTVAAVILAAGGIVNAVEEGDKELELELGERGLYQPLCDAVCGRDGRRQK